jgi:predicted metal-dependent hydrolase
MSLSISGNTNRVGEDIHFMASIHYILNKPVIVLGEQYIPIDIHYDKRKHMQLILEKDPKLVVKSPKGITEERIMQVITNRMDWILKRLKRREEINPFPSKFSYIDGEKHLYMGTEYELRIQTGRHTRIWFSDPYIEIELPDPSDSSQVQSALQNWYADQTMEYVSQRTWYYLRKFIPEKLHSKIEFKFRRMKSRWGSCSAKGLITFNKDLIRAPREAIDYLIVHELCHLKHFNHSKTYYEELTGMMPEWKTYKRMLERISL